jgi:glycosyltransferase involved in cell wall biosynthesis
MSYLPNPNITLSIFGDGPSVPEIRGLIDELRLDSRVFLRGVVREDELPPFYRTDADVFVFPSTHREGFPMAFFTALACGLGTIATRVRPLPDYLEEPTNCLWIEAHDPMGLARQIERLSREPDLLAQQQQANPALTQQFSPTNVAKSFLKLYEALAVRAR